MCQVVSSSGAWEQGKQGSPVSNTLVSGQVVPLILSTVTACTGEPLRHITFCSNFTVSQIKHSDNISVTQESKPFEHPLPFTTTNVHLV